MPKANRFAFLSFFWEKVQLTGDKLPDSLDSAVLFFNAGLPNKAASH